MRKRIVLALVLVAALLVSTGCSLIMKDEEVDKQTPIIEVAGKTITKGEVQEQTDYMLGYYEYMYYMYGMNYDRTDPAAIADAQNAAIEALVQDTVLRQKIAEGGFDVLTDEEAAEVAESVDSVFQIYQDSVKTNYFVETELEGEELDTAIAEKMLELGYGTKEAMLENEKLTRAQDKLRADTIEDVAVTDEEVSATYAERVDIAKNNYAANPAAYGTDVSAGANIYYVPAGYRQVKHILVNYADEDADQISELESQVATKQTEWTNAQTALNLLGADASADDEETAKKRADLTADFETKDAELTDLQTQLDEVKAAAYAAIEPTLTEIQEKIVAGEDFDALIEQYGQDPGMKNAPAKDSGYPVCAESTNWVASFQEASMALNAVGDVSAPVTSSYGVHIIKYVADAIEGEVGLDTVKDSIYDELLSTKQDETFAQAVNAWVEAANAKIYADRMN